MKKGRSAKNAPVSAKGQEDSKRHRGRRRELCRGAKVHSTGIGKGGGRPEEKQKDHGGRQETSLKACKEQSASASLRRAQMEVACRRQSGGRTTREGAGRMRNLLPVSTDFDRIMNMIKRGQRQGERAGPSSFGRPGGRKSRKMRHCHQGSISRRYREPSGGKEHAVTRDQN